MVRIITCFLLSYSMLLHASIPATGSFQVTQSCPAYVSKNSKSNPNQWLVKPNETYPIREINKSNPDWIRIEVSDTRFPLRWVNALCGHANVNEQGDARCDMRRGKADTHILALSSQPGFCQTYGYEAGKPECLNLSARSYQANHLTLHGLWPNQDSCGPHYGYCDVQPKANHCDYSPLNLSAGVSDELNKLMPSYKYGSCLERHEWTKHGSCQILSDNDYFALALRLTNEVNHSVFGQFLTKNRGQTLPLAVLRKQIEEAFGVENSRKIYLGCKNGILVDVYVILPALIPMEEPLEALLSQVSTSRYNDACSQYVKLSAFHKGAF